MDFLFLFSKYIKHTILQSTVLRHAVHVFKYKYIILILAVFKEKKTSTLLKSLEKIKAKLLREVLFSLCKFIFE